MESGLSSFDTPAVTALESGVAEDKETAAREFADTLDANSVATGVLTLESVEMWISHIEALAANDDETAHRLEDALCVKFMRQVADGHVKDWSVIRTRAQRVLSTKDVEFSRWYA